MGNEEQKGQAKRAESLFQLDPARVAIVLVDFQNDFCSPDASGKTSVNTRNAETARRANAFARRAAKFGVRTIYTRQVLDLDRLTTRQRPWEEEGLLCQVGSAGAELFIEPIAGSEVVRKWRFDTWQSSEFLDLLAAWDIDGLVIGGVELRCCTLYAVLGAEERGYHYVVAQDLVSGLDNDPAAQIVRDYLDLAHPTVGSSQEILARWEQSSTRTNPSS